MFKTKSTRNHEQALALIGMVSSLAGVAGGKGRGAERLEAMASVIAAMGFDAESVKEIEIDWKIVGGEYLPVLRMKSSDDDIKELVQSDRYIKPQSHAEP